MTLQVNDDYITAIRLLVLEIEFIENMAEE